MELAYFVKSRLDAKGWDGSFECRSGATQDANGNWRGVVFVSDDNAHYWISESSYSTKTEALYQINTYMAEEMPAALRDLGIPSIRYNRDVVR